MNKKLLLIGCLLFIICSIPSFAITQEVNFQGRLLDSASQPISTPRTVTYRLYDNSNTQLWAYTEDITPNSQGVFSTILPIPSEYFDGSDRWVEVDVNGNTLSPKQKITTVPYAYRAITAESLAGGGAFVRTSGDTMTGKLTISPTIGAVGLNALRIDISSPEGDAHAVDIYCPDTKSKNFAGIRIYYPDKSRLVFLGLSQSAILLMGDEHNNWEFGNGASLFTDNIDTSTSVLLCPSFPTTKPYAGRFTGIVLLKNQTIIGTEETYHPFHSDSILLVNGTIETYGTGGIKFGDKGTQTEPYLGGSGGMSTAEADLKYVFKSGDTMTGKLTVQPSLEIITENDIDTLKMTFSGNPDTANVFTNHFNGASSDLNYMKIKIANITATPTDTMILKGDGSVGINGEPQNSVKLDVAFDQGTAFGVVARLKGTAPGYHDGPKLGLHKEYTSGYKEWTVGMAQGENVGDFIINEDGSAVGDGTTRFVVKPGGNVGIGTLEPNSTLKVIGSAGVGSATVIASGANSFASGDNAVAQGTNSIAMGGYGTIAQTVASGDRAVALGGQASAMDSDAVAIGYGAKAVNTYAIAIGRWVSSEGVASLALGQDTTASGDISTTMGTGIRIADTGDKSVGIGLGSDTEQRTITEPNTMAIVAGRVVIGTTEPTTALRVEGTIETTGTGGIKFPTGTQTEPYLGGGGGMSTAEADLKYVFKSGDTMTGTLTNSAGASFGGNVGIGTTTPNNLLQVTDLIDFDNTHYNTMLGHQAGKNIASGAGAEYNTYVGYQSGYSSSTESSTGNYNTAVGFFSLYSNTTGLHNVAIGADSLYMNTSGWNNTAIGENSMLNSTTGYMNTAVGVGALYNTFAGTYNIGVGIEALYHSAGSNNTGIGYRTGFSNYTGNNNVMLGYSAGLYETGSNTLYIDNLDRGSVANGKSQSLIYGVSSTEISAQKLIFNAKVAIGTTEPTTALRVEGTIETTGTGGIKFPTGTQTEPYLGGGGGPWLDSGSDVYLANNAENVSVGSNTSQSSYSGNVKLYANGVLGAQSMVLDNGGSLSLGYQHANPDSLTGNILLGNPVSVLSVSSNNSLVAGYGRSNGNVAFTVLGKRNIAFGHGDDLTGGFYVNGENNIAMGENQHITGNNSMVIGQFNNVTGSNSFALGSNMDVSASNSFGIGLSTTPTSITTANTMAIMGGNVGIASAAPSTTLEVYGDVSISAELNAVKAFEIKATPLDSSAPSDAYSMYVTVPNENNGKRVVGLELSGGNGKNVSLLGSSSLPSLGNYAGAFSDGTRSAYLAYYAGMYNRYYSGFFTGGPVYFGDNVAIGTSEPTSLLTVKGTVEAIAFKGDGSQLTNLPGGGGGMSTTEADARYVQQSGDTMIGDLTIEGHSLYINTGGVGDLKIGTTEGKGKAYLSTFQSGGYTDVALADYSIAGVFRYIQGTNNNTAILADNNSYAGYFSNGVQRAYLGLKESGISGVTKPYAGYFIGNTMITGSLEIGTNAQATGQNSIAVGFATASNINAVAIGSGAVASGAYSFALGPTAMATEQNCVAMGLLASAGGGDSVAMGQNSSAASIGSIALGYSNKAMSLGSIALGYENSVGGYGSVALGNKLKMADTADNSIGVNLSNSEVNISQPNTMAIVGGKVTIGTPDATSSALRVEGTIETTGTGGIKFPTGTQTEPYLGGAGGGGMTTAEADAKYVFKAGDTMTGNLILSGQNLIFDQNAPWVYTTGVDNIVIGNTLQVAGSHSLAIGEGYSTGNFRVDGNYSVGIGEAHLSASDQFSVNGDHSIGVGYAVQANGSESGAFGKKVNVTGDRSFGFGENINVSGSNSIGFGLGNGTYTVSQPNTMAMVGGRVAIGTTEPGATLTVQGSLEVIESNRAGSMNITDSNNEQSNITTTVLGKNMAYGTAMGHLGAYYNPATGDMNYDGGYFHNNSTTHNVGVDLAQTSTHNLAYSGSTAGYFYNTDGTNVRLASANSDGTPGYSGLFSGGRFAVYGTMEVLDGANGFGIKFPDDSVQTTAYLGGASSGGWTDDGAIVRLTYISDKVGIGTAEAHATLTVYGSLEVGELNSASGANSMAVGNGNAASATSSIALGQANISDNTATVALGSNNSAGGGYSAAIGFGNGVGGMGSVALGSGGAVTGNNSVAIGLYDYPPGMPVLTKNRTMAIMGGNVGIGTTEPGSELTVYGTIETIGTGGIKFPGGTQTEPYLGGASSSGWTDDGTIVRLTAASDKVGIGTSVPGVALKVVGSAEIGDASCSATGANSFAIGLQTKASGIGTFASGWGSSAGGALASVALGYNATSYGSGAPAIAIGQSVTALGNNSLALGFGTTAEALFSTALGQNIWVKDTAFNSIGISLTHGNYWSVSQPNTMAIVGGRVAIGTTEPSSSAIIKVVGSSVAGGAAEIGSKSNTATGLYSVALGDDARASGIGSVAMGNAYASSMNAVAMGNGTSAKGNFSTAMGTGSQAEADYSLALGYGGWVKPGADYSISIGLDEASYDQAVTKPSMMAIKGGRVAIGTSETTATFEVKGETYLNGPFKVKMRTATVSSNPSTVALDPADNVLIHVNTNTDTIVTANITLPSASTCSGRRYIIIDNSSANVNLNLNRSGSDTINQTYTTYSLTKGRPCEVFSAGGTSWFLLAQ